MSASLLIFTVLIATAFGFNKSIPLKKKPLKKLNISDVADEKYTPPLNKKPIDIDYTAQFFYSPIGLNVTNITDSSDEQLLFKYSIQDNKDHGIKLKLGTVISGGYVECSATSCFVDCSGKFGCSQITINATQSKHLHLTCANYHSCDSIDIITAYDKTSIDCYGEYSCLASNIIAYDSPSVIDLQCQAEYSCAGINISSLSTELVMNCSSHYSCYESIIYLSYQYMHLSTFHCNEYDYNCYDIIFYIDKYEEDFSKAIMVYGKLDYDEELNIICDSVILESVCDELTFCSIYDIGNVSDILEFLLFDNDTNRFICEEDSNCCFYSVDVDNEISAGVFTYPDTEVDTYTTTLDSLQQDSVTKNESIWTVNTRDNTASPSNSNYLIILIVVGTFALMVVIYFCVYCRCKSKRTISSVADDHLEGTQDENDNLLIEEQYVNKLKDLAAFISMHPEIVTHGKEGLEDVTESTLDTSTVTDVYESSGYSHLDTKEQIEDLDVEMT